MRRLRFWFAAAFHAPANQPAHFPKEPLNPCRYDTALRKDSWPQMVWLLSALNMASQRFRDRVCFTIYFSECPKRSATAKTKRILSKMICQRSLLHQSLLIACLLLSIAAHHASAVENTKPATQTRPNVIVILTDDQGWMDGQVFGHPYMKTPNIDRLAAAGTRYQQFYVSAPVCSPSRATFMTGRYPARDHMHHICLPTTKENDKEATPIIYHLISRW